MLPNVIADNIQERKAEAEGIDEIWISEESKSRNGRPFFRKIDSSSATILISSSFIHGLDGTSKMCLLPHDTQPRILSLIRR